MDHLTSFRTPLSEIPLSGALVTALLSRLEFLIPGCPETTAGSDGRRNTIQRIDSTVLPRLNPFASLYSVKP
jgi:hypothetical protein